MYPFFLTGLQDLQDFMYKLVQIEIYSFLSTLRIKLQAVLFFKHKGTKITKLYSFQR